MGYSKVYPRVNCADALLYSLFKYISKSFLSVRGFVSDNYCLERRRLPNDSILQLDLFSFSLKSY